ncbi:MAG: exodeoxyribonuclease VII large subunit, partial [Bdellovibrionales bacterium]|nr:exodeoxyribonuclease VII large subunit [Oligoflexia bacterium]
MSDEDLPLFQASGLSVKSPALSVSEITYKIKSSLESDFSEVWVKGEISNLKVASSGHVYFSLKDDGANLSAAAFGWGRKKVSFQLKDGLEVLCRGNISVYAPRGNYQLLVDMIEPLGAGALQLAFDQLKQKLQLEGLFETKRKREIPKYPSRIVVITSPQAAALRDVLTVLKRRAPFVEVILVPTLVQGQDAAEKIMQAIKVANHYKLGEVILLTRGGGSIEDLWSFNHEELARVISSSEIPIISAVGHEVDFTIADFVSDLRAPTPSAGAEILSQHWVELRERTRHLHERLFMSFRRELLLKRRTLEALAAQLKSPRDQLREKAQRVDELSLSLERCMRLTIERRQSSLGQLTSKLHALSPLNVLSRGYALVQRAADKKVLRSSKEVKKGD